MTIDALQRRAKRYFRFNWKDSGKRFRGWKPERRITTVTD